MNEAPRYIVTHGGKAHRDEVYTCCFILAHHPRTSIFRREPTAEELEDESVCVLDIGGRHEPEKNNFDHHQFDPSGEGEENRCAFSLYLESCGLLDSARNLWKWMRAVELLDCKGRYQLAKMAKTTWDLLEATTASPVDDFLVAEFGRRSALVPGAFNDWLDKMMISFGRYITEQLNEIEKNYVDFQKKAHTSTIKNLLVVDFPIGAHAHLNYSGMERWIKENHPDAAILIYPDDRDLGGICLYRRNDHPNVNFHKVEGLPDVRFTHKGGFIAKLFPCQIQRAKELCELAIS